jgi:hypothetical protein
MAKRGFPAPLEKAAVASDSLIVMLFGYETLAKTVSLSDEDVGDFILNQKTGLRSNFLHGIPGFDSILAGFPYTSRTYYPVKTTTTEYRLANAFRILGYNQLRYYIGTHPDYRMRALYGFQANEGMAATGVLDAKTLIVLDSLLWVHEMEDGIAARNFPSFPFFMPGPVSEPSIEHVAMLLASFSKALPPEIQINATGAGPGW